MIHGLVYSIVVMCINIIFPPVAVLMVAGGGWGWLFELRPVPSPDHSFPCAWRLCDAYLLYRRSKVSESN